MVIRMIAGFLLVLALILIWEAILAFQGEIVVEDEDSGDEGPIVTAGSKVC